MRQRDRRPLSSRLKRRLDIIRPTETKTGGGGYTTALVPVASAVPAEIISLTGSEAVKDRVLRGIRVYRITIRWRADVGQKDQISFGAERVNIRSAVDPDGSRRELVIHADTEGVEPA
ncbi:phage head closure protein [uncultured Sphingomonas sp.]|uniref:phage head closure protein n=1 Tax=uncultured Sphingomonas sp. TaxID=158754 RepID=UPI0025FF7EF9|nr:phage head closure protein [uncultured Sphingomonas sp.]